MNCSAKPGICGGLPSLQVSDRAVKLSNSGKRRDYVSHRYEAELSPRMNSNEKITKVTARFLDVMLENAGCLPAVGSVMKIDCPQHSVIESYSPNNIIRSYKTLAEKDKQSIATIIREHLDFFMKQRIMVNLYKAEVLL